MFGTILMASAAGIIGTGLGGILGLVFGTSSKKAMSYVLSFASGVMISIACFDLVPEALTLSSLWIVVVSIFIGIGVVQLLNGVIDKITNSKETHVEAEELRHQKDMISNESRKSFIRSGLIMLAAIALHNLPEGLAIGSGASHDANLGLTLAFLIALHNIPEGMSIAVPLVAGGMKKWKVGLLTALSGAPTLVGGLLGAVLGNMGDFMVAGSLGIAAGAMLYVTYCEILPEVILLNKGRRPALFSTCGIIFGLIITNIMI